MNNSFKEKYLKYKNKYLTLQKGGTFKITVEFCYYEQDNYMRKSELYTDISEAAFYNKYNVRKIKSNFALVNSCNQDLSEGGGVAGAIYRKNRNVFEHKNGKIIFNPNKVSNLKNVFQIINELNQKVTIDKIPELIKTYPAGTVCRIDDTSGTENDVDCAYHIKGIDLRLVTNKIHTETQLIPLMCEYYKSILNDFYNNKSQEFLHIPPIPGNIFNGTKITEDVLYKTVHDFINEITNPKRSFTIILALNENNYKLSKPAIEPVKEPDITTHHKTGHKVNIFLNYPDKSNPKTNIKNLDFYNKFDPLNNKKFALVIDAVEYHLPFQNKITHIINKTTEVEGTIIYDSSEYTGDDEINRIINKQKQIYDKTEYPVGTVYRIDFEKDKRIGCIYYVNSIDLNSANFDSHEKYLEELIMIYYNKILEDFHLNKTDKYIYITLIPKKKLESIITIQSFLQTILSFLKKPNFERSFTIILECNNEYDKYFIDKFNPYKLLLNNKCRKI